MKLVRVRGENIIGKRKIQKYLTKRCWRKGKLKEEYESGEVLEKKEIGEAVNRGPCICHLLGSIVTPSFFPPLHFVTIIAIIREEHFSDATTMGRYLYTLVQPTYTPTHTYTHTFNEQIFSYCADPERNPLLDFIVCFDTEVSCGRHHSTDAKRRLFP